MAEEEITKGSASASSLDDDVIELILGYLSITDIPNAALVSKTWLSLIASGPVLHGVSNSIQKSKPWLFVFGESKKKGLGFDPGARRWVSLPELDRFDEERDIMEGNGFLFSVAGSRLSIARGFLNPRNWHETAARMHTWRHRPVVCYSCQQNQIIVIGGACGLEENVLCVEMFDAACGAWEICEPLPDQFKESASSSWLSAAACNGKIWVLEKYTGDCCCFDVKTKRWGRVAKLRPSPPTAVVKYYCLACRGGLVLAGLMREEGTMSFRMWIVDENTMECKADTEIRMPCEMMDLLVGGDVTEEEDKLWCGEEMECRGGGDLVYVLRNSRYEGRRCVCLCDLSTGTWEMLSDPWGVGTNCRERMMWACSPVTLGEISLTLKAGRDREPRMDCGVSVL